MTGVADELTGQRVVAFVVPPGDDRPADDDAAGWHALAAELEPLLTAHVARAIGPVAKPPPRRRRAGRAEDALGEDHAPPPRRPRRWAAPSATPRACRTPPCSAGSARCSTRRPAEDTRGPGDAPRGPRRTPARVTGGTDHL
ncbi:AMP-binding enzyme [Clavibacter zhangzhiyongii]|uniref:AMP-binding enzyme n=1 Tax=Clavibacter zhangzhiyongii TaxID=2768071 RepID=UPI0039E04CDE